MANEIALPAQAAERVRRNMEVLQKQQLALTNFVEGIAAGLDVPPGWELDPERMVWVAPKVVEKEGEQNA